MVRRGRVHGRTSHSRGDPLPVPAHERERGVGAAGAARRTETVGEDGHRVVADGGRTVEHGIESIVDQIADGVFLKDRDGRYEYVNRAGAALFDATPAEIQGATDEDLFDPETAAAIREDDEAVMDAGEARTAVETREFGSAGRVVETTKHPYRPDPDGPVEGVVGVAREVTDRTRSGTENERERNERALRSLQWLASDRDLSFEEKLEGALRVGRQRLGLPLAFLTRVEGDTLTVVTAQDGRDGGGLESGSSMPLRETYCRETVETSGLLAIEHAAAEGWGDDPAYERFGIECYLGGEIRVANDLYGTLCFADSSPRERAFTESEETFIELLIEWVSYELERRERERELEGFETILQSVDDGVYELDAEGRFTFVNPGMAELTGYDPEELLGEHLSVVKDDPETAAALDALLSGEATERSVESAVQRKHGRPVPCEDSMTRLEDADGTVRGAVGVVRDVTEQKAHREMLSDLVEASRTFMQARDREEVARMIAQSVKNVLGFDVTVVRLFDREDEQLVPAASTTAAPDLSVDPATYGIDDDGPAAAFVDGETTLVRDATGVAPERRDGGDAVRSAMHLPMGVHGTISIGAGESDAFSDVDRRAAELLATSGAAAANRAKREGEVREARERVDALVDRINGLIENTVDVLVHAGTREQLERGVVEQLVATEPYAFAWIGQPDLAAETLEATAWDGDVPELAEAVDGLVIDPGAAAAGGDPAALALEDEELQVLEDLSAAPDDSVTAAARAAGLGSVVAVPLTYKDASYGVLTVYAGEGAAVAERERVVLAALGRAVANAINAIESGRILTANRVIELEFSVQDADVFFGRLSAQLGADLDLAGSVYESDGSLRLYATATGTDAEAVREVLDRDDDVTDLTIITDHDGEVLFEATVAGTLVEWLADHGAATQAAAASEGIVRFTIELPYETEAREVFELVEDRYDRTELVGYHEHERPVRTRQEFREAVFERFTDRQETAVRTAYLGGFFEWPRDVDGDELAGSMDIARPTFHQHLRAAQRKVFEELFDHLGGRQPGR
ncbi:MAG: bacterio-opsin activator domain-containing protein [Haloarculaceae archaeon]